MPTHIGIGFSREKSASLATREAALQAKVHINQKKIDVAIILSTIHYNPLETLYATHQILNTGKTVGCSAAGIILSDTVETRGIAILAICSDDIKFGIGSVGDITPDNALAQGCDLARAALADFGDHHRGAMIILPDGLLPTTPLLIRGTQEILGRIFPIVGGGSGDDLHFKQTYQYFRDKVSSRSAVALLLGGPISVGVSNRHGWKPLGKPRIADKTEHHIIKTIDGKRASLIYEEYFSLSLAQLRALPLARTAILYPIGIYTQGKNEYVLRNPVEILDDGSIVCQGDIPKDSEIHIMIGNKDFCKQSTAQTALDVKEALGEKQPRIIFVFSSIARHKILGREAMEAIRGIKETFGFTTPIFGMYSYGEIGPARSADQRTESHLQNESISILGVA